MVTVREHLTIYKDPYYFLAFPSCVVLDSGEILVSCRRALDPRYLLGDDAPEDLRNHYMHVEARSHQAVFKLGSDLKMTALPRPVAMNPQAADQDGCLLKLSTGRILMSAFSWYPLPPPFAETVEAYGRPLHGSPEKSGTRYLFWGAFVRHSDDQGSTWSDHLYLPQLPGAGDIIPGKRPTHGGATRGQAVESEGEILLPVYSSRRVSAGNSACCYVSKDDGVSWEFRSVVAKDQSEVVQMLEPTFHRTPSGKILCFIRTANLDHHLVTAESTDNGHTWSDWKKRNVIGLPYMPLRLKDDRVLLLYGYRQAPYGIRARLLDPECSDLDTAPEYIIRDDGLGGDLGYPWGCVLPGGDVLVLYYFWGEDGVRHIAGSVLKVG